MPAAACKLSNAGLPNPCNSRLSNPVSPLIQIFRQHQFRPATTQNVIDLIKGVANQVQSQPAGPDQVDPPTLHRFRLRLLPVVAQAKTDAIILALERERDELVVPQ